MLSSMVDGSPRTVLVRAYMSPLLLDDGGAPAAPRRGPPSSRPRRGRNGLRPGGSALPATRRRVLPGEVGGETLEQRPGPGDARRRVGLELAEAADVDQPRAGRLGGGQCARPRDRQHRYAMGGRGPQHAGGRPARRGPGGPPPPPRGGEGPARG